MKNKDQSTYRNIFILSIISGIILRFYNLGEKSLWQDEQWTEVIAGRTFPDLITYLVGMADRPPLHLLLTNLAIKLGEGEFFLRLVPALSGIAGIFVIFLLGKKFYTEKEAAFGALLLALSPYHIAYSQEATAYTLFFLFSTLSLFFLLSALEKNSFSLWAGFVLSCAAAFYTSYFFLFLLSSFVLVAATLWLVRRFIKLNHDREWETFQLTENVLITNRRTIYFLLSIVAAGLLCLPWMPVLYDSLSTYTNSMSGIERLIVSSSLIKQLAQEIMSNHYNSLLLLFFLIGFVYSFEGSVRNALFIFWGIVTPFLIMFALKPRYSFYSRYIVFILPFFLLTISRGIIVVSSFINDKVQIKTTFVALSLLLFVSSGYTSPLIDHYQKEKRDWRTVSSFIAQESNNNDIVVIEPAYLYYPFFYYLPIDKKLKAGLIDPLAPARRIQVTLPGKKTITVCYFDQLMKPGVIRRHKRIWYLLSAGSAPEWVLEKFDLVKKVPGAGSGWDVSIYLIDVDKFLSSRK